MGKWTALSSGHADPGQLLTMSVSYGNRGAVAAGVRLTVTLPTGVAFAGASPPPSTESALVWDVGDLPGASGPFSITLSAMTPPAVDLRYPLTGTAGIGSLTAEQDVSNNASAVRLNVSYSVSLPVIVSAR
jgi:hypothetical protein